MRRAASRRNLDMERIAFDLQTAALPCEGER